MTASPLQAALAAVASQAAALAVAYGIVDNGSVGKWIALTMAIVNAGAVIAHAIHARTPTPPPLSIRKVVAPQPNAPWSPEQ